jgi:hypothetical protein
MRRLQLRPKLLKDHTTYARWPFIFYQQEGMSFNPIRPQGCLQYIVIFIAGWFALAIFSHVLEFVLGLFGIVL